jgi:hypothetical protein
MTSNNKPVFPGNRHKFRTKPKGYTVSNKAVKSFDEIAIVLKQKDDNTFTHHEAKSSETTEIVVSTIGGKYTITVPAMNELEILKLQDMLLVCLNMNENNFRAFETNFVEQVQHLFGPADMEIATEINEVIKLIREENNVVVASEEITQPEPIQESQSNMNEEQKPEQQPAADPVPEKLVKENAYGCFVAASQSAVQTLRSIGVLR